MKLKKFVVPVVVLIVGIGIGALGALVYSGRSVAWGVMEIKTGELFDSYEAATLAYQSQSPETAIWALDRHLELIDKFRKFKYPPRFLDTQAILVHARLAKLYDALGKIDEKRDHVRMALDVAQSSISLGLQKITSEEGLFVFLTGVDDPSTRDSTFFMKAGESGTGPILTK
jgi:hypothetical protein